MERSTPEGRWIRQLDVLRAVGCLLVLAQHIVWATAETAVVPEARTWWLAWSQFLLLGGPLFFFASAVLCFLKYPEGKPLGTFWRKRFLYLGAPYAVWSIIYLLLESTSLRQMHPAAAAQTLGIYLVFGVRHLQFVNALFQFYLVFPLLRWIWNRADRWVLVLSSFLVSLAWNDGVPRFLPEHLIQTGYSPHGGVLLAWLPFLALGAWAAERFEQLDDLVPRPRWMYAASAFLLSASAILAYGRSLAATTDAVYYAGAARPAVVIAAALWLPFVLRLSWTAANGPLASLLREVGRYSPAIFFVHPLTLAAVAWVARGQESPWPALVLFGAAAVFGTSLIVSHMMRTAPGILLTGMGRRCERLRPRTAATARRVAVSTGTDEAVEPEARLRAGR